MLIKTADDKGPRQALLQDLAQRPGLDARTREWARDEALRQQHGMQGERDAAHFLDNYLRDDPDRMLIHDLRLVVDGEVAQIDHLMLTRGPMVYLLETKCFNGQLRINAQGEFSVRYGGGREYGIGSPIEQSRRHEGPLRRLMKTLGICGRAGAEPLVRHCVLVHPKGTVERPPPRQLDTGMVIKADQFRSWHERLQNATLGLGDALKLGLNMRSAQTTHDYALMLARQHRAADPLALPDFVKARLQPLSAALQDATPPAATIRSAPAARAATQAGEVGEAGMAGEVRRKLVCAQCGGKISFAEGKFCWNQAQRFGGVQYCREHQAGR